MNKFCGWFIGFLVVYGLYQAWSDIFVKDAKGLVVITGCNGGIGQDMSNYFSDIGFDVISTVRRSEDALRLKEFAPKLEVVVADLAKPEGVEELARVVNKRKLVALVHNAGITSGRVPLELDDPSHYSQMAAINSEAVLKVTLALAEPLKQGNGRVIYISSIAAETAVPGTTIYTATKSAGESITLGLARELYPWGVRGIVVRPGAFKTDNPTKNWHWTDIAAKRHKKEGSPYPGWWKNQVEGESWKREISGGRDPRIVSQAVEHAIRSRNPGHIIRVYSPREWVAYAMITYLPSPILDAFLNKVGKFQN